MKKKLSISLPLLLGLSTFISFFMLGGEQLFLPHNISANFTIIPSSGDLAGKFQSGEFQFQDILTFALYLIKMAGSLAGLAYMMVNIFAGVQYITGSMGDDKESGKNAMVNAVIGFGIVLFSWVVVDIVIAFLTTS